MVVGAVVEDGVGAVGVEVEYIFVFLDEVCAYHLNIFTFVAAYKGVGKRTVEVYTCKKRLR